jgi:hypothetical protein
VGLSQYRNAVASGPLGLTGARMGPDATLVTVLTESHYIELIQKEINHVPNIVFKLLTYPLGCI